MRMPTPWTTRGHSDGGTRIIWAAGVPLKVPEEWAPTDLASWGSRLVTGRAPPPTRLLDSPATGGQTVPVDQVQRPFTERSQARASK